MKPGQLLVLSLIFLSTLLPAAAAEESIRVFILAGDENVLAQGQTAPDPNDRRGKDVPGTLVDVMAKEKRFSFLKGENGEWVTRPDVVVYDAHRIHNETVAIGRHLAVQAVLMIRTGSFRSSPTANPNPRSGPNRLPLPNPVESCPLPRFSVW